MAGRGAPAAQRARYLAKIHEGLKTRADEIARTIAAEVGTPLKMAQRIQAIPSAVELRAVRQLVTEYAFEEQIGNSLVVREPVGVVAAITPWNYPLHQIAAKVAPALAAGCTVVLKPSEIAPLNAFILAEIIHESGLPAGVFNLISGTGVRRRRGAGAASRRGHGVVHGFDSCRQADLGTGRRNGQARRSGAGRQVRFRGAGRC